MAGDTSSGIYVPTGRIVRDGAGPALRRRMRE
jgi:hypothetical protein